MEPEKNQIEMNNNLQEEIQASESVNSDSPVSEKKNGGIGPIIGSIIIIVLIVLAGLYYWGSNVKEAPKVEAPVAEEVVDQDIAELEQVINTDELDSLDNELNAIEAEIDAELNNL